MADSNARTYVNPAQGANLYKRGVQASNEVVRDVETITLVTATIDNTNAITHSPGDTVGGTRLLQNAWYVISGTSNANDIELTNNAVAFGQNARAFSGVFKCNGDLVLGGLENDVVSYRLMRLNNHGSASLTTGINTADTLSDTSVFDSVDIVAAEGLFVAAEIKADAAGNNATSIQLGGVDVSNNAEAADEAILQKATLVNTAGNITLDNGEAGANTILAQRTDVTNAATEAATTVTLALGAGMHAVRLTSDAGATMTATFGGIQLLEVTATTTDIAFVYSTGANLTITTTGGPGEYHVARLV